MKQIDEGQDRDYPPTAQRPHVVLRAPHPEGEEGWCSCCHRDTAEGVRLQSHDQQIEGSYFFLCLACARQIGEAAR